MAQGGACGRWAHFLDRHLLVLLIGAYFFATVVPGPATFLRNGLVRPTFLLLALLLFNAGVGVRPEHLRRLPQTSRLLVAGLAGSVLVPLVFLFAAAATLRLWHNPDEAQQVLVGLALVAAMPVAGSSSAWAQQADGDLAVSLGLVLSSTLLSPLTTPAALRAAGAAAAGGYADALADLAGAGTGLFLLAGVLVPIGLGIACRKLLGESKATAARGPLKVMSATALLTLCYANAAVALPRAVADRDWDFLAVTVTLAGAMCAAAFAGGWAVARLMRADRGQAAALVYGMGMSNNGTGLVIGATALAGRPEVLLPVIAYNLLQHLGAAIVHRFGRRLLAPSLLRG
jgi:BASS family bile acid:Na+ symporter